MTRVYDLPEYAAFIRAMRAAPDDAVAPLVCADWLEEHGKADHARFVRACCRMRELRAVLDECAKCDLHYTDPTRAVPEGELFRLLSATHPLIDEHVHEWTGVRKFANPTPYDWPNGFLRTWAVAPSTPHVEVRLAALLRRQPVHTVHLTPEPDPPDRFAVADCAAFSWLFRGVTFRCGDTVRFVAEEVPA